LATLACSLAAGERAYGQCGPARFGVTGSLTTARSDTTRNDTARHGQQAVALPSGKVLIVGGASTYYGAQGDDRWKNQSADLYDPAIGRFTSVALGRSVTSASLTRLASGKVLIAGGLDPYTAAVTAVASVYDPQAGAVTNVGSLLKARENHTATLLGDGTVLITGGQPDHRFKSGTASAELFDPATGSFSPLPDMSTARAGHTATPLHTGKVLIVSGLTSELYDPGARTFGAPGRTAYSRFNHTATRLHDGRVLLAGGDSDPARLYGNAEAEIYDPATNAFTRLTSDGVAWPAMMGPRHGHTATLLPDGRVLIAGGHDGDWSTTDNYYWRYSSTTELFDPATRRFSFGPPMTRARSGHTATSMTDGRILMAGGQGPLNGEWIDFFTGAEVLSGATCTGITYQGCFTDDAARALPVRLIPAEATVESCVATAAARGLPFAGLQWYGQCYAGYAPGYSRVADSECSTPCSANPAETCGGPWRSSIFTTTATPPPPPPSAYRGCYTDDGDRALDALLISSGATVETCVAAAGVMGFAYAGLQDHGQCFGGSSVGYSVAPSTDCNTPCSSNPAETCGGLWRNSVYATGVTPAPVSSPASLYRGCYTDDASRALPARLITSGATVESCITAARSMGFAYAGLQWYGHCFAGGSPWYAKTADQECNTPCSANPTEICGGPWRNSIYAAQTP
jgi:hypothetical protein